MQTVNDLFETQLRKRVSERIADLKDQSSSGIVGDLNVQNFNNGRVAALIEVFSICDDVQADLAKR